MVYAAFFFPLYREGLSGVYLIIGFVGVLTFVLTPPVNWLERWLGGAVPRF